jgi:hypothetical protein
VCSSELQSVVIAIGLELFVVTTCKWSINLFFNPNPVYSHTYYVTLLRLFIPSMHKEKHTEWNTDFLLVYMKTNLNYEKIEIWLKRLTSLGYSLLIKAAR